MTLVVSFFNEDEMMENGDGVGWIYSLLKCSQQFCLIDVENGYFLTKYGLWCGKRYNISGFTREREGGRAKEIIWAVDACREEIPVKEGTENGTVTVDLSKVNFQIRELLKRKGCKNGPVIKTQAGFEALCETKAIEGNGPSLGINDNQHGFLVEWLDLEFGASKKTIILESTGLARLFPGGVLVAPTLLNNFMEAHVDDVELVSDSNLFGLNAFSILLVGKEIMAPSSIGSHFNPTFEGPVESMVKLDKDVLQSRRHSYVSFKESDVPKKIKPSGISDSVELGKGHSASKGRGSGEKGGVVRSNRVINKIIRDRGGRIAKAVPVVSFRRSFVSTTENTSLTLRKQNQITTLKNEVEEWIFDEEELGHEAISFFQNLYGEDPGPMRGLPSSLYP
ncbi:hypothetical protein Goari_017461 [Gossypium aridum]|uniref:Uncharacterized protein n=1 Tax=Gossypium aridum TaxID=34290 RepID=A0A7J8WLT6_GOSAI|nr:hypothetical protein [Gossypium aridum]